MSFAFGSEFNKLRIVRRVCVDIRAQALHAQEEKELNEYCAAESRRQRVAVDVLLAALAPPTQSATAGQANGGRPLRSGKVVSVGGDDAGDDSDADAESAAGGGGGGGGGGSDDDDDDDDQPLVKDEKRGVKRKGIAGSQAAAAGVALSSKKPAKARSPSPPPTATRGVGRRAGTGNK